MTSNGYSYSSPPIPSPSLAYTLLSSADSEVNRLSYDLERFQTRHIPLTPYSMPLYHYERDRFSDLLRRLGHPIVRLRGILIHPTLRGLIDDARSQHFDPCALVNLLGMTVQNDMELQDQYIPEHIDALLVYVRAIGSWIGAMLLQLLFQEPQMNGWH
ncbi:hypothetical protein CcaverHIS002_0703030 [Cutaneotrichosporon cavernicola]|uniref:Uncharacterized protein n=1 Tax=Cutaneotrichosporon cavernicola TaxID=279322 RepID=A0AA48LA59_9TREE|nr:uncharacterized protein CcaverHIS019_0703110 [Cutaneotrichosporon cavernicola]BEI86957.1 hypothetical protein CcaverHIS002_0703030 [Cutaneotrichosporon cavernicola]BEI94730.1 hypothetical protein CcaverHIS019_0703110 [Cutaneotrichosporon cavernicola]BEJ02506.1 hypothetical protein CcaverHIS631_0703010 [Cutaneotrichosporon cavernicola]BEJ10263.1 hypothetical protein CcaverHIS641_0702980 [Cutaneotrichosporon cavernicola]